MPGGHQAFSYGSTQSECKKHLVATRCFFVIKLEVIVENT